MKTTIDIADGLLEEARARAKAEGTTVRALAERGLREVLTERAPEKPWRFEPVTGELHPEPGVDLRNWDQVREIIYGDVP
ncbi:MAG: type II toxin-antitoxin system VapB family antitoxin [Actinomycetota bacterium]|nr:type II toxin-antitoxin system VapB family antitoxin [Actinomycetota bacterium]